MSVLLWLVIPVAALVVGIIWAYLLSRPPRPAAMVDSMESFSRFRGALARHSGHSGHAAPAVQTVQVAPAVHPAATVPAAVPAGADTRGNTGAGGSRTAGASAD